MRRQLIERGLMLMISRGLVSRHATPNGFMYQAEDDAGPFLDALTAEYLDDLKDRAVWVVDRFGEMSDHDIRVMLSRSTINGRVSFKCLNSRGYSDGVQCVAAPVYPIPGTRKRNLRNSCSRQA